MNSQVIDIPKPTVSRSRSRSPRQTNIPLFPLILTVSPSIMTQKIPNQIMDSLIENTKIDRIHYAPSIEVPDFTEGLVYIYSSDINKKFAAFKQLVKVLSTQTDGESKQLDLKMLVPPNMVAMLIGRNGKQVHRIQEKSGTVVEILEKTKGLNERQVRISGKAEDVETAVRYIYEMIIEKRHNSEPREYRSTARFILPNEAVGALIGKSGQFTKHLRSEYDVDLKIVKGEGPPFDKSDNIACLAGKFRDVKDAIPKLIQHLLDSIQSCCSPSAANESLKMLIPSSMTLKIIGPKGYFIKEISSKSRSRIKVLSDKESDREYEHTIILIEGSLASKQDAAIIIFKEIEILRSPPSPPRSRRSKNSPANERNRIRSPRHSTLNLGPRNERDYRDHRDRNEREIREKSDREHRDRSDRDRDVMTINIAVPEGMVSRLIGKNGDNVKNMIHKSGCNISFQKPGGSDIQTSEGQEARMCTLKGTTSQIASGVKVLMEQIIKLEE